MIKTAYSGLKTAWKGLALTIKHFFAATEAKRLRNVKDANYFDQQNGIATVQYPHQQLPIPEVGRYQLDVVIEDCIVCDLCAKICPVDCIEIESIKGTEVIGKTSDGSVKRLYAPKFDIDMAKCMFCGLCTTVCPTECITMTNEYDKSFTLVTDLTYHFADMTEEEAELRREELETQLAERKAAKEAAMKKAEEK